MDIHLTDFEIVLFDSIVFPPDYDALEGELASNNAELARILAVSLFERAAIPEHRLRFFEQPEHNVTGAGSVREKLQETGLSGDAVH